MSYYRVSGQPTATFTSCGPGSANMPHRLGNAFLDSVPFLAVTGNVPTSQFNRGAFQEIVPPPSGRLPAQPCAHYCKRVFQPTRGEQMPYTIREAWKTMVTGRPGPVVLDVPFDIFKESTGAETPDPDAWVAGISCKAGCGSRWGSRRPSRMLMAAERPAIFLIGQAAASARHPPPAGTGRASTAFPSLLRVRPRGARRETTWRLGLVARNGMYQANQATRQADV
ncbi:MAG: thiamine pyrophosphate-binding protein [Thalassobaculum sp.]